MNAFLAMGGYGAFIWPCYGLAIIFVIALYLHSQQKLKAALHAQKAASDKN